MKTPTSSQISGAMYVRESTEEQDAGYSPEKQRKTMLEYAAKNKIKIVREYKDLVSGRTAAKRADFQRMLKDARQGKFKVILVFHSSRFARNVEEARRYKKELRSLGVNVVSVTQHFGDPNHPTTLVNEGINELFDEYYSEQLSFWMKNALMEKREQGYPVGNPPLGYRKKKGNTRDWFVDKKGAQIINEMFTLYASGKHSMASVAVELNKKGYRSKLGKPFTYSSIKCMLQNEAYLGYVVSAKQGVPNLKGHHSPILTQKLFDQVQDVFKQRRGNYGRPVAQHRFYLLQGLIYCYPCYQRQQKSGKKGKSTQIDPKMYCKTQVTQERYYYGCKLKRENKSCQQKNVECSGIDQQVLHYMRCFQLPEATQKKVLDKMGMMFESSSKKPKPKNEVETLKKRKKRLNFMFKNTDEISEEDYLRELREINDELAKYGKLGLVEDDAQLKKQEALEITQELLKKFDQFWDLPLNDEERRSWIQMTIKKVWIQDKKVVAIEPHDDFKPLFVSTKKVIAQSPSLAPLLFLFGFLLHTVDAFQARTQTGHARKKKSHYLLQIYKIFLLDPSVMLSTLILGVACFNNEHMRGF